MPSLDLSNRSARQKPCLQHQDLFHLLLLEEAGYNAQALIQHLNNAGYATRVHPVTSVEDLRESLAEQPWDLLLVCQNSAVMTPEQALAEIHSAGFDIPALLLLSSNDFSVVAHWLSLGGCSAVPYDQHQLITQICEREWYHQALHQRLKESMAVQQSVEQCNQQLLQVSNEAIAFVLEGMYLYANPAYLQFFGLKSFEELEHATLIDMMDSQDHLRFKQFFSHYRRSCDQSELEVQQPSSNTFAFTTGYGNSPSSKAVLSLIPSYWQGIQCTRVVMSCHADPTLMEQQIQQLKNRDQVTGFYNRHYFFRRLDQALAEIAGKQAEYSVMQLHLDHYLPIKRELGIELGEQFLNKIAGHLATGLDDEHVLARHSNGIFLLLLPTTDTTALETTAQTLIDLAANFSTQINHVGMQSTASIGIVPIDSPTLERREVLGRAEKTCRRLHQKTPGQYQIFEALADRYSLAEESDALTVVRHSIEQNQFNLRFQPIVNIELGMEQQYEVSCLPPEHPSLHISPKEFRSLCLQAGLTQQFDHRFLLATFNTLAELLAKGDRVSLFISLSRESLEDHQLIPWLSQSLQQTKVPAELLVFQIDEKLIDSVGPQAVQLCHALRAMGARIAITNCDGSLIAQEEHSTNIPCDFIKLDANLIQELELDRAYQKTLQSIIGRLKKREQKLIAPGIQSSTTLSLLCRSGVQYAQGDFLHPSSTTMDYSFD